MTRRALVPVAIVALVGGLGTFLALHLDAELPRWLRGEAASDDATSSPSAPSAPSSPAPSDAASASAASASGGASSGEPSSGAPSASESSLGASTTSTASGATDTAASGATDTAASGAPVALLDRPLRVVSLRGEAAAPIVVAAGGATSVDGSIVAQSGLAQEVSVVARASEVEEALARGGIEAGGADVAIVPLATWVSSYDRLAALETEAFFVAGFSRGAEVLFAGPSLRADERLPSVFAIAGDRSAPETLVLLSLLAEAGVDRERLRFVSAETDALMATADRESSDAELRARGRRPWMSSADAPRLAPWVVIAPRSFVRAHQPALVAWASSWLQGAELLARDVPRGARVIAAITGAPPLVDALRRLGHLERVDLAGQAELAGLSGRSFLTLEALFLRAWSAYRATGVVQGPPPETLPIATGTIATLVRRTGPAPTERAPFRRGESVALERALFTFPFEAPRTERSRSADADATSLLVARLGFVAAAFPRSMLVITVPRDRESAVRAMVLGAVERYGLETERIDVRVDARDANLRVLPPL
jgi:hypothetical protein